MRIPYVVKRFRDSTLAVIHDANAILREYVAQGYDLTLRQLYYKLIARDLFPDTWIDEKYNVNHGLALDTKNTDKNYKRLGKIISNARLAGLTDWKYIVDRTRGLKGLRQYLTPEDAIISLSETYHIDMWSNQPSYVEAWVEKDAMVGILARACNQWDIPYSSTRGYTSQSACHIAAKRLKREMRLHKGPVVILHMSDHDPSGIDMGRDIQDRFEVFGCGDVVFKRLALTMEQVEERDPPPNPAKLTDPRAAGYIDQFGEESWELDALEPRDIDSLITRAVRNIVDIDCWNESLEEEKKARSVLRQVARSWDDLTVDIDPKAALDEVDSYCDPIEEGDGDEEDPEVEDDRE